MTRINLLPWREMLRKEREREFYSIAGGAAVLMLLVIFYIHFHMAGVIETQNSRNAFLGDEIKKVEGQIKEIKGLETEKSQLLARMKVIEELQGQRPQMVHLFDELVKALPDGVYVTSIKQKGTSVSLDGIAQYRRFTLAGRSQAECNPGDRQQGWPERQQIHIEFQSDNGRRGD